MLIKTLIQKMLGGEKMRTKIGLLIGMFLFLAACGAPENDSEPTPNPTQEVIITSEIAYTSQSLLDVYAPSEPGSYPVVVAFHGASVNRLSFKKLGIELAKNGIVLFSADWHSNPITESEEYLLGWEEAACAVRYARQHATEYQGDSSRIIVIGHSAGGEVGATITLAGDEFSGDCMVDTGSALADGFVGLEGAFGISNYFSQSVIDDVPEDIVYLIDPYYALEQQPVREAVEFILFVGDKEQDLIQGNYDFYDRLVSMGYNAEVISLPDTSHTAILNFPRQESVDAIIRIAYDQ